MSPEKILALVFYVIVLAVFVYAMAAFIAAVCSDKQMDAILRKTDGVD